MYTCLHILKQHKVFILYGQDLEKKFEKLYKDKAGVNGTDTK